MPIDKQNRPPGRWKPGQSGNPKGKPAGSGEVQKMRAAMAEHVPALVAVLVERALTGDTGAARLLLERTIAPLKASEQATALALPDGTLTEQGRAVLGAVAAGDLAPGPGALRCWAPLARWRVSLRLMNSSAAFLCWKPRRKGGASHDDTRGATQAAGSEDGAGCAGRATTVASAWRVVCYSSRSAMHGAAARGQERRRCGDA